MAGFVGGTLAQESFWLADFVLFWVVSNTAYRILMTWVYSRTASIPVAQVMHAFFSGTFGAVLPMLLPKQTLAFDLVLAICLWVLVAILALVSRQPQRQRTPQVQALS